MQLCFLNLSVDCQTFDILFDSHVGIKQLVFGGSEFENWKENLTSEDAGCSIHKI